MTYIETLETKSERSLRRSAGMWLSTLVAAAVLSVVAAKVGELTISIAWLHVSVTLGILLCLGLGYIRYARRPADRRLGVAMRSLLTIFAAGSAGGLVSLLGQTFAFPLIDEPLAAADRALGLTAVDITGAVVAIRALPLVLAMAYLTTIPLIILSVVLLSLMGRFDRAWELSAAFSFCMLVATASSLFFPAVGPFEYLNMPADFRAHLPENSGVYHLADLYELRSTGHFVIDPFRLQGVVTFPSFHVAMAAMTVAAWRDDRRLRWWMLSFNLVVILSTVPIGGHYLIDLPAGLLCWAVIFYAGPVGTFLRQRWADYTDARDELWEGATSLAGN